MIRLPLLLAAAAAIAAPAVAQTVRFQTNAGSFDLTLNPTSDPNLQGHVDNLLANVLLGNYDDVIINRADPTPGLEVVQLGSFLSAGNRLQSALAPTDFTGTSTAGSVTVDAGNDGTVDFNFLPNTRGTVSLATQAGQPNTGGLSFFVNLGDNTAILDPQGFVPFAEVSDLAVFDAIFNLPTQDFSFAFNQPGPTFTDIPFLDGELVVIDNATLLLSSFDDPLLLANPLRIAAGFPPFDFSESDLTVAPTLIADAPAAPSLLAPSANSVVPEPGALGLLGCSLLAGVVRRRR